MIETFKMRLLKQKLKIKNRNVMNGNNKNQIHKDNNKKLEIVLFSLVSRMHIR